MSQRSLEEMLAAIDHIDGWLSPDQAARLYKAASTTDVGDQIVEIGSYRGRSTVMLAGAAPEGVAVVAIDPHAGNDRGPREIIGFESQAVADHEMFNANLAAAGVAGRVRHIREFSDRAYAFVSGPVAVLYIDGAHRHRPALSDIRAWGSRVERDGTMLIHDSFSSVGVTLAIARELFFGSRFRYVGRSRSLVEYRADLGPTWQSRVSNTLRQVAQLPWFAKNLALKILLRFRFGGLLRRVTGHTPEWPY